MRLVVERSWVGRRVVLRRAVGSGTGGRVLFGDVVGDLLELRPDAAIVESNAGPVEVALEHVALSRLVLPAAADVLALEGIAAQGWRAQERTDLDGWVLRADAGFTGRANSALPLRQLRMGLDEALAAAGQWYHDRGLPLRLQVPLPARRLLDAALREKDFVAAPDVAVLAARLDALPARLGPNSITVSLSAEPDDAWLRRYRNGELPAAARELLVRHDRVAFASVVRNGRVIAIGRGAVDDGWLGVTAVEVEPDERRQGLATAVMTRLWTWAQEEHSARYTYLQVESLNTGALELYAKLGYWPHHEYRYLTEPA